MYYPTHVGLSDVFHIVNPEVNFTNPVEGDRWMKYSTYTIEWIEPATGKQLYADKVASDGQDLELVTPVYTIDVAMRLFRL